MPPTPPLARTSNAGWPQLAAGAALRYAAAVSSVRLQAVGRCCLVLGAGWLAACARPDDGRTAAATTAAVPAASAADPTVPTWAREIAPLLHRSCTPCHRPGQPAPFALLDYADGHKRHRLIAEVTQARTMPPWLMTRGDFAADRRLSAAEVELLQRWSQAGAPRGDAAAEPAAPWFPAGWQWKPPDLVLAAPRVHVPADGPNLFRNVVIPLPLAELRYVEAVEIRPGNPAVHHAVLAVDSTRTARRLDALDPAPGFAGMAAGVAEPPDGHFLGWTPGKQLQRNPPGMAFRLRPGQDLVLQLHLVPTGKPEQVAAEIGLHFTTAATTVEMFPLVLWNDRIDLAPGERGFLLRDHFELPVAVQVHRVYPHAHYLCRRMQAVASLPDGSERELFAIEDWNFDWQDDYQFQQPVALPPGTRVAFVYEYDNSKDNPANPHRPPRRVRFGQESTDEMGTLALQVTVADAAARIALAVALLERDLQKAPADASLWRRLAGARREAGRLRAASEAAQRALQLEPMVADSHAELGLCREREQDYAAARRAYAAALRLDPEHGMANLQLGGLLARSGDAAAARQHFERALLALPNLPLLHCNLATACFQLDDARAAEYHYRQALAVEPQYAQARFLLGRLLLWQGRRAEAKQELELAARLRPDDQAIRTALREAGG